MKYFLIFAVCFSFSAFAGNGSAVPQVVTASDFTRGATIAFAGGSTQASEAALIKEKGVCWSTQHNPTINDAKSPASGGTSFLCRMNNLQPATVYYVRAYAVSTEDEASYGDEIKIITIPKGNITYTKNWNAETDPGNKDHYDRITAAVESAIEYWTNLTSIQTHLTLNYGSGTPTAEASYGGWMRFGPNSSYQRTGTALHEMAHTIGVGTHSLWSNTALHADGVWLGERANKVLQIMSEDPSALVKGDSQHFWPYGINGAHEDDGSDMTYLINAMIVQAFGEDGVPPSNGFATPAYTLDVKNNEKYYIKTEDSRYGRDNSFLIEDGNGNIVIREMTPEEAIENDSAAWYLDFDPATRYYSIQNVETGKYFVYKSSGKNGMGLTESTGETLGAASRFQLMASRTFTWIGDENSSFRLKGYWIVYPQPNTTPPAFALSSQNATSVGNFNIANTATTQRWLILDGEEIGRFARAVAVNGNRQWEEGAEYVIHPAGLSHSLRSRDNEDEVDIVRYTQSEPNYSSLRWKITSVEVNGEKRYVFTNAKTQKVLTLEKWTAVTGEEKEVTAYAHTKSIAYDPENADQQLQITFTGNIDSGGNIIPVFAIGNGDNYRLDHFGNTASLSKVGNSYSAATAIPASQQWALTLEKQADTAIPDAAPASILTVGDRQALYIKNLPAYSTIAVYDIAGKAVTKTRPAATEYWQELPKGIYIVSIRSAQQQIRKKVIIN